MRLAYMAHPLGPDGEEREKNRANATKWFAWLHDNFPAIAFTANWVLLSAGWPESDEHRKRGLEIDMVHVERADMIFYVGGRLSPGMLAEQPRAASRGMHQIDLTFLGYKPPEPIPENWVLAPASFEGVLRELNKALERIAPLDPELRWQFQNQLVGRLSMQAMGHGLMAGREKAGEK